MALASTCFSGSALAAAMLVSLLGGQAHSGTRLDAAAALERSEAVIGQMFGEHRLVDADGLPLTTEVFRGKPLVVSLVYTSCSSVCPASTQHLKSAVARARGALGADAFSVLTVGFDARNDTPARMAAFAADQDIDGDRFWRAASGGGSDLDALLRAVGFSYSGVAGGFEHVAQTTIVDAEGRIYRQVYGDDFPVQMFVEPLKALVFGVTTRSFTAAGLADRIRFLCTVYDPRSGRYRADYSIVIGIFFGGLSLILMGWVILRMWAGRRRLPESPSGL